MRDVKVKMKDGRTFCAPLWHWKPSEGWFTLVAEEGEDAMIYLRDVESAVEKGQRIGLDTIKDVDLLERARNDGWDGK